MAEDSLSSEQQKLLRQATVRLQDPKNTDKWGTGFFIAKDVLLTCWHVVEHIHNHCLLVQQPFQVKSDNEDLCWIDLGEATLLEQGGQWDLALLKFTAASINSSYGMATPEAPIVLPIDEQDPAIGTKLATTAFPEDCASRHDATYESPGRTTPAGQSVEFIRIKSDGVVPGFSGSALLDLRTKRVCGVIARNQLPGGASDGGQAVPMVSFRSAFPLHGESVLEQNSNEAHPGFVGSSPRMGRCDWSWPNVWDFTTYRKEKREGFVGREWLFEEVRAWATNPQSEQAMLIRADYGVGKSAFLAELIETGASGIPLAAQHFCTTEQPATLTPELFLRNLSTQIAKAIPAYQQALEADGATDLRRWLDEASQDPARAFDQSVLAPLAALDPAPEPQLLVVDAIDESQDPSLCTAQNGHLTILQILARYSKRFPRWLKILATSRQRPDVIKLFHQSFVLKQIDAEGDRNLDDLRMYAYKRCNRAPLSEFLSKANLSPDVVAEILGSHEKSSGKFLYVELVLNEVEMGWLTLTKTDDLQALPSGLEEFYKDSFERRLPTPESYLHLGPTLALLSVSREPLNLRVISAVLGFSEAEISEALLPVRDLLRLRLVTTNEKGRSTKEVLHSFDHSSLKQWLCEADEWGCLRAGRYAVNLNQPFEQMRSWLLSEIESGSVHEWPYLVRHFAYHLHEDERPTTISMLLWELSWLDARLCLAGINPLLDDLKLAFPSQRLELLGIALRQSAHVLDTNKPCGRGSDQLASQLLARLRDNENIPEIRALRLQAKDFLIKKSLAVPVQASLVNDIRLQRIFQAGGAVSDLVRLTDGRLAVMVEGNVRIFDPKTDSFTLDCRGVQRIKSLVALPDSRFATLNCDDQLHLWEPDKSGYMSVVVAEDCKLLSSTLSKDGRLITSSNDKCISFLNPGKNDRIHVFEANKISYMYELIMLPDGRIACSLMYPQNGYCVELIDPSSGRATFLSTDYTTACHFLGLLRDGRLLCTSIWGPTQILDPATGERISTLSKDSLNRFVETNNGHLICGNDEGNILIWDSSKKNCVTSLKCHDEGMVSGLAVLDSGQLVTGSSDGTIRIWDLGVDISSRPNDVHEGEVKSFAIRPNGFLASGSADTTIRLWDPVHTCCTSVFKVPLGGVESIAVVSDGRIAIGCFDGRIRLWNPDSGEYMTAPTWDEGPFSAMLPVQGNRIFTSGRWNPLIRDWYLDHDMVSVPFREPGISGIYAIQALADGRLASGSSDGTIQLWEPASGKCIGKLKGHKDRVTSMVLLPDGRLASGSYDSTIRLWDTYTGETTHVLEGHDSRVNAIALLADGRLASGSIDKTILLWDLTDLNVNPLLLFVADAGITALITHPFYGLLIAGDYSGRLHWLRNESWLIKPPKRKLTLVRLTWILATCIQFIATCIQSIAQNAIKQLNS